MRHLLLILVLMAGHSAARDAHSCRSGEVVFYIDPAILKTMEPATGPPAEVTVDSVSLDEAMPRPQLSLSPLANPAVGRITLRFSLLAPGAARLDVLDVQGRRMLTRTLERSQDRFVLDPGSSLPAGVYFVQLSQGGQVRRAKLTLVR